MTGPEITVRLVASRVHVYVEVGDDAALYKPVMGIVKRPDLVAERLHDADFVQ